MGIGVDVGSGDTWDSLSWSFPMSLGVGVIERILNCERGWWWSCVSIYPLSLSMGLESVRLRLNRVNRLSTPIYPSWFIECSCKSLGDGIR